MLAWLTPDVAEFSGSQKERTIVLPGNLFFLVTGAISQLAEQQNWEVFGTATPEQTAQFFMGVLEDYLMSDFRNVGMIGHFVTAVPPFGWLEMNGQVVSQADYPELTNVVPSSWLSGGDINLPDTRGKMLRHVPSGGTIGATGGSETHTLTADEMPTHVHQILSRAALAQSPAGSGNAYWGGNSFPDSGEAGGGQAHNNMPPYFQVKMCIYSGR